MKKKIAIILAILTLTSLTACGQSNSNNSSSKTESSYSSSDNSKSEVKSQKEIDSDVEETTKNETDSSSAKDFSTLDGIETAVTEDVENTISELEKEFDSLKSEIDTYDKYLQNTSEIEDFYNKIVKTNEDVCIRLYEYALEYANIVVNSNSDSYDKYDDLKGIYDCIYDDAGKDIYNGIYDGVLKDMYKAFYEGVLDDSPDDDGYSKWSDTCSQEYDWYSDACSDTYDFYSDTSSDIYDFYSDVGSAIYKDDMSKAQKRIDKFEAKIEKLKNK